MVTGVVNGLQGVCSLFWSVLVYESVMCTRPVSLPSAQYCAHGWFLYHLDSTVHKASFFTISTVLCTRLVSLPSAQYCAQGWFLYHWHSTVHMAGFFTLSTVLCTWLVSLPSAQCCAHGQFLYHRHSAVHKAGFFTISTVLCTMLVSLPSAQYCAQGRFLHHQHSTVHMAGFLAEGASVAQAFINRLVWDNGYTQVVGTPTRGDSLLDVYLVRPESSLISCDTVQGISDHCGVLLDVEWTENVFVTQEKRLVPVYHKANVLGLQQFLHDKLPT